MNTTWYCSSQKLCFQFPGNSGERSVILLGSVRMFSHITSVWQGEVTLFEVLGTVTVTRLTQKLSNMSFIANSCIDPVNEDLPSTLRSLISPHSTSGLITPGCCWTLTSWCDISCNKPGVNIRLFLSNNNAEGALEKHLARSKTSCYLASCVDLIKLHLRIAGFIPLVTEIGKRGRILQNW